MGSIFDKIKSDVQDAVTIAALGAGVVLGDAVIEGVDKAAQAATKGLSKAKDAAGDAVQDIKEKGYDLKRSKMANEKKVVYLEIQSISEDSDHPYEIFDKKGNLIYYVNSFYKKKNPDLVLYGPENNVIGAIKRKMHIGTPLFEISVDGQPYGTMVGKLSLLKDKYSVQFSDWRIDSDLISKNYTVYDASDNKIAVIQKQKYKEGKLYAMNIIDPKDTHACVLLMIAVDSCQ